MNIYFINSKKDIVRNNKMNEYNLTCSNYPQNISSSPTNPLGFNSLSNMTRDMVEIYKEYEVKLSN